MSDKHSLGMVVREEVPVLEYLQVKIHKGRSFSHHFNFELLDLIPLNLMSIA